MHRIGVCAVIGALVAAFVSPVPSAAFGLHIGPFDLGLPLFALHRRSARRRRIAIHFGHRRRMALRAPLHGGAGAYGRASLGGLEAAQTADLSILYPSLALPHFYDDIFRPNRSSSWPFGYEVIFRNAFAKSRAVDDVQACQPGDRAAGIVERVRAEIRPDAAQMSVLRKLGQALGAASGFLIKACPKEIPPQPVARLELMQSQIEALSMAIDVIRPPLGQFEQSLNGSQRARFTAMRSAAACSATPTTIDWSIDEIDQAVQAGDTERQALSDLRAAFASAAGDLDAHCPKSLPSDPLARLQAIEARLDASWRAALAMQTALAKFESGLSDRQRSRFEAINVAQAR